MRKCPSAPVGQELTNNPDDDYALIYEFFRQNLSRDLSPYKLTSLKFGLDNRCQATQSPDLRSYIDLLHRDHEELGRLINALAITVSHFFREPLTFEYLDQRILPALCRGKVQQKDHIFTIWSAGCAGGAEPYSMAMLLKKLIDKEKLDLPVTIFATDVNPEILGRARQARYPLEAVQEVKYEFIRKYFSQQAECFQVIPAIKKLVQFSEHDLTDSKKRFPADSVYGRFDLVLCRNVLIYFQSDFQRRIMRKLCQAVAPKGYLVLGKSEEVLGGCETSFRKVTDAAPIYQKIS